jgi:hypothetical protein
MDVQLLGCGVHNGDLRMVRNRILNGHSSYRRRRVITVIPAVDPIPPQVYLSHVGLQYPPNQATCKLLALGQEVAEGYNNAVSEVVASPHLRQWEYLLTLEADNVPPWDGIYRLIARLEAHPELSAVGGLYFCKGEAGWNAPHIWGDPGDPVPNFRPQPPRPNELVECNAVSMGFTLFRVVLFLDPRLRRPWFRTRLSKANKVTTQDMYFWEDARRAGHRCAVDCAVKVGHLDAGGEVGPAGTIW